MLAIGDAGESATFDPSANVWSPLSPDNASPSRGDSRGIWTGTELLFFGGFYAGGYHNDVVSYIPSRNLYLYQRP